MCAHSNTAKGTAFENRRMGQMIYDSEAGRVTAVYRVLDMRRPIWSLRSMMDSGCNVYFSKDRCWIAKKQWKELDVFLNVGVFFMAERATSTRVHAGFGVPGPAARDTLDGEKRSVRLGIPMGPVIPSAVERKLHKTSGYAPNRRWCRWCAASRAADEPQPETDEAVLRIEFDSAELEREEDQTLSTSSLDASGDGPESSTAILCSTKTFSEHLAFVW